MMGDVKYGMRRLRDGGVAMPGGIRIGIRLNENEPLFPLLEDLVRERDLLRHRAREETHSIQHALHHPTSTISVHDGSIAEANARRKQIQSKQGKQA